MTTPHVVVIGGGFGGLSAAKALRRAPVRVTLVDRTNHHLFQPLLYQVATAGLSPSDISVPIRWALRAQRNVTVRLGDVTRIDVAARALHFAGEPEPLTYDYLIAAPGSRHAYFGHDAWEPLAPGLKSLDDALEIRRRFLLAFERAEHATSDAEREALMTFVIVGGGPTGVELAGTMVEIAHRAMPRDFRRIDTRRSRVVLLEGGPRLLPTFPEGSSDRARRDLERLGVEVRTGASVTDIAPGVVTVGDTRIASHAVFWAAGNQASPLGASLGVPLDRAGRVLVEPDLSIPGHQEVFVVGDLAAVKRNSHSWVAGVAPAANQEGTHAARNLIRLVQGAPTRPFAYLNKGDLATIGRNRAVAVFGRLRVDGILAWLLWVFVHIMYLVGFRNRAIVLFEWAWAWLTFQRGVRLITGGTPSGAVRA
ncbi:MAG: NAD(P)/FAD-dependent oxidoreductase [Gemmatimonadetes bacterium]|nr:NAD(P)/FAD-dependent oxidoreductase [Gemmatimonadota bacterium]MBI3569443.1 NAD(P)/FAD-dependent oxidoreductase [Gemmatimonadota bacterium]